jgi:hypothetical protein
MAMYLQQKKVEATVLAWIQAACMLISDDIFVDTAESREDMIQVHAALKGHLDEWKPVCSPCVTFSLFSLLL